MTVREFFFLVCSDVTYAGYLLEFQEHANLMAAVQMRKVRSEKRFPLIRLKNGLDRLLNTLFPSEKRTKINLKFDQTDTLKKPCHCSKG